jgi:hypothetical protein
MSRARTATLALAAAAALAASGCGSSSKSSSQTTAASTTSASVSTPSTTPKPTARLTRAQLIEQGDAICYRLNARRASTRIEKPHDYENLVPALATYELQGASELGALTPPPSLSTGWQHIVNGSHTIAEVTGHFPRYSEAERGQLTHKYDIMIGKAISEVTNTAKRIGFKECSRYL